ncbi:MAG: PTS sugar transporter subunit IIA [Bacillota bacterium]
MSIRELISPATVSLDLRARTADEAFVELGGLLEAAGVVSDLNRYLGAVREREAKGTTAVGFGVAIPHGKSAGVLRAGIAFGRANHDLVWESLDGEPVRMVFLIAAPEGANDLHLRALSQLARQLMHAEFRTRLTTARTPSDLLEGIQ